MKEGTVPGVLLIYLEPTPYVLGLVQRLRTVWSGPFEVFFVDENLSQAWGLTLNGPEMALLPQGAWAKACWLYGRLRKERYSLVHLAGWGHPFLLTVLLIAGLRGIPVAVESDTPLAQSALHWRSRLKRTLHPLLFRLPAVFLPGGKRQSAYLRHYGVPEARIHIAQMTVDVTAISRHVAAVTMERRGRLRARFGLSPDVVVFLYVGRLEANKGLTELINAFSLLRASHADTALLIVGDGSLRGLVDDSAVNNPRIHAPGRLQGADLLDAYALADVFVLASRFEPWGLVVNEAMAAGLPVIATDRVGCGDDLIAPDATGLVVRAEDPLALMQAMVQLAVDAETRRTMGLRASQLIAGWTLEEEAARVTAAWQGVLAS